MLGSISIICALHAFWQLSYLDESCILFCIFLEAVNIYSQKYGASEESDGEICKSPSAEGILAEYYCAVPIPVQALMNIHSNQIFQSSLHSLQSIARQQRRS